MSQADGTTEYPAPAALREAPLSKGPAGFAGGVAALGGGAVVAHLLAFAAAPILSRLFPPEAFGTAEVVSAVILVLGFLAALRYESAVMLPESDADAANLLAVGTLAVAAVTGAVAVAMLLAGDAMIAALNATAASGYYLPAIVVGVATFGLGQPLRAWVTRHRHYRRLGGQMMAETFTSVSTKVAAGLSGWTGPAALIFTGILGRAVPVLMMLVSLARHDGRFVARSLSLRRMGELACRYARFPLIDLWSGLLTKASFFLPLVLLGVAFGAAVVGHYSRAMMLVHLPLLLVGNAVGQVFFQQASARQAAGRPLGELVEGVLWRLAWIAFAPLAMVAVIGPDLFAFAFGGRWAQAGVYAQLLAPGVLAATLVMPLATLLVVRERLGRSLAYNAALAGATLAALLAGGWIWRDARAAMLLMSLASVVVHGALGLVLLRLAGASAGRACGRLLRCLLYAAPMLAVAAAGKWWLALSPWQLTCAAAVASASYWTLALRHDAEARDMLMKHMATIWRSRKR